VSINANTNVGNGSDDAVIRLSDVDLVMGSAGFSTGYPSS
jgi:hypothetical protein